MKLTLSWLRDHLDTTASVPEIAEALTDLGLEVEGIHDPAAQLRAFSVAKVLDAQQHPNADKLRVCQVETDDGVKQIVCGAPNARAGITVDVQHLDPGGVSREEREMAILSLIADGDGDFVVLNDLQHRDELILKDLADGGYIAGKTFFGSIGRYRITSAGEKQLRVIEQELVDQEGALASVDPSSNSMASSFVSYLSEHLLWPIIVGIVLLILAAYLGLGV